MDIDLHGYHPSDINVENLLKQAWETGASQVTLIHGHGHKRGISVGLSNTHTG
jgi:DNA-nicking Smr family endonuclease